jgi:proteasome accessory factor C
MAGRASSAERARRIISLLGRLRTRSRIPLADLARELDVSEQELSADLTTLSMSGVTPYDPWALFPVSIEDGEVVVFGEVPEIRGPIRLSKSEAAALAAGLQTAGLDAQDALTSRLLEAASADFDATALESSIRSTISAHDASVYGTLAEAVGGRRVVEIEYLRVGSNAPTHREIEPIALFAERGAWYVTAWCRLADSWRTFRVDRIRSASCAAETFESRCGAPHGSSALETSMLPVARLRFEPREPFVPREWPGGHIVGQDMDGSLLADVPYAGTAWIARRVTARTGRVEAVGPVEVRAAVRELAAELAR